MPQTQNEKYKSCSTFHAGHFARDKAPSRGGAVEVLIYFFQFWRVAQQRHRVTGHSPAQNDQHEKLNNFYIFHFGFGAFLGAFKSIYKKSQNQLKLTKAKKKDLFAHFGVIMASSPNFFLDLQVFEDALSESGKIRKIRKFARKVPKFQSLENHNSMNHRSILKNFTPNDFF